MPLRTLIISSWGKNPQERKNRILIIPNLKPWPALEAVTWFGDLKMGGGLNFFSKAGPFSAIAADRDTAWHWDLNSVNLLLTINELSLLMIKTMFSGFVVVFLFLQCEDPEFDSLRDIIGNQGFLSASNLQLNLRSCLFNVVEHINKQFSNITLIY